MIRPAFLLTVCFASALGAQTPTQQASLQQPDWIAAPGATVTVHITRPDGQMGPVLNKPLSAVEVRHTQQTLADGTHVNKTDSSRFFRDAQGRMRDEGPRKLLIFDPVAGHTYTLDPDSKTYQEWSAGDRKDTTTISSSSSGTWISTTNLDQSRPVQAFPQGQLPHHAELVKNYETEDLGSRMVNGVFCKGSRTTITIPAATLGNDRDIKIVDERWTSEDLGALVKSSNSDPRFGLTSYELTNIIQNSPDEKLFEIPADYTLKQHPH